MPSGQLDRQKPSVFEPKKLNETVDVMGIR